MSKQKQNAVQRAAEEIRKAAAKAIVAGMNAGSSFSLSHLLGKVRETLKNTKLVTKDLLTAMKTWFDGKIATFNNKNINLTAKGVLEIKKLAAV